MSKVFFKQTDDLYQYTMITLGEFQSMVISSTG